MRRDDQFETKINEAKQRFEQWRQQCGHRRGRIPEQLWEAAAALARCYGVYVVARTLRLEYAQLKRRCESKSLPAVRSGSMPFVEVAWPGIGGSSGHIVELENRTGGRMTIRLHPGEGRALVDLTEIFLRSQP